MDPNQLVNSLVQSYSHTLWFPYHVLGGLHPQTPLSATSALIGGNYVTRTIQDIIELRTAPIQLSSVTTPYDNVPQEKSPNKVFVREDSSNKQRLAYRRLLSDYLKLSLKTLE